MTGALPNAATGQAGVPAAAAGPAAAGPAAVVRAVPRAVVRTEAERVRASRSGAVRGTRAKAHHPNPSAINPRPVVQVVVVEAHQGKRDRRTTVIRQAIRRARSGVRDSSCL